MPFSSKQAIGLLTFLITFTFLSQELFSAKASPASPKMQEIPGNSHVQTGKQSPFRNQKCNILIWGGGYSPSGNQISLESNIRYFERIKEKIGLGGFPVKTLFADGKDPSRDIQFLDPNFTIPESTRVLAEVLGSHRGLLNQYRNNRISADGSSSVNEIDNWIEEINSTSPHSLNLIYFTGHGGKGDKKTPHNTHTYLWNNSKIKVSELSKKMDKLPVSQKNIFIMVQCYSGGFANIIFEDGDPEKGLSKHNRAGFFATVHDRVAAGCTPDIREKNYREYSTRFWEALSGESRMGKKTVSPDYNMDGKTSLSEAHAYVIIHSETIDIPVKTSDIFLRNTISFNFDQNSSKGEIKKRILPADVNQTVEKILNLSDSIGTFLKFATPSSEAIITSLANKLQLNGSKIYNETKVKVNGFKIKKDKLSKDKKSKEDQKRKVKDKLKLLIKKEWPELTNLLHPKAFELQRAEGSKKLLMLVQKENNWSKIIELKTEIARIEKERFITEKNQALAIRLQRELENVFLKEKLYAESPFKIMDYDKITELENLVLGDLKKSL